MDEDNIFQSYNINIEPDGNDGNESNDNECSSDSHDSFQVDLMVDDNGGILPYQFEPECSSDEFSVEVEDDSSEEWRNLQSW